MANSAEPSTQHPKVKLAAPLWHTLGLLMILLAISLALVQMRSRQHHYGNVTLYSSVIISEWALSFYIWIGGMIPGAARLHDLVGGCWSNIKDVLHDIALAAVFWVAVTGVAVFVIFALGSSQTKPIGFLDPRGVAEVTLWVAMSITAGFCEELVYRGYLQRQFLALTGNAVFAVLAQGVLFGVAHWYQGFKMVIVITLLGILFGMLAYWRKSLRPGMIAHALGDIVNLVAICLP